MSNVNLFGAYELTDLEIDRIVSNISPGVYLLGSGDSTSGMGVQYVGRSDSDLNNRLKQWVGNYTHFFYAYCSSPAEAYYAECNLYHKYNPKDNSIHPASPAGQNLSCPKVNCAA